MTIHSPSAFPPRRRVVITGLGMISPLGLNVEETWSHILQGHSGVRLIDQFDTSELNTQISASIQNFDPIPYISPKDVKKMDLFIQYGLAATKEAIQDANIEAYLNTMRAGVAIGSGIGGLKAIADTVTIFNDAGPRRVSPFFIPSAIINMLAGHVSIQYKCQGPNIAIVTACTTGTHNIGFASRMIAYGDADIMITGGAEMATCPIGIAGFSALRALSTRNTEPTKASRPWDKDRDGFVLGDGAGILILEEYEHAKKRKAKIYAELVGFGMSADAFHMTSPHEEGIGAIHSMQQAIQNANISIDQIDYINAHGTSTPTGDIAEVMAIKQCLGEHAYQVAISSTKSMTGHLLGAAGAIEAIFSILAIRDQIAPPTINLDNPDIGCDLDFVPHQARPMPIKTVLSNSFGFGGTNGTLIFTRLNPE